MQQYVQKRRPKEELAIVLDFLKNGYPDDPRPLHRREPIVQAIGKAHFVILELIPQPDQFFKPYDEVYIGEGKRDKISYIKGTLPFNRLTQTAKTELMFILEKMVTDKEKLFVDFYNKSGPISLRAHQLELLPGIGKAHAKELLAEREKEPFNSFEDIKKRVTSVSDPKKAVINRILAELEGRDRYKIFVGVNHSLVH